MSHGPGTPEPKDGPPCGLPSPPGTHPASSSHSESPARGLSLPLRRGTSPEPPPPRGSGSNLTNLTSRRTRGPQTPLSSLASRGHPFPPGGGVLALVPALVRGSSVDSAPRGDGTEMMMNTGGFFSGLEPHSLEFLWDHEDPGKRRNHGRKEWGGHAVPRGGDDPAPCGAGSETPTHPRIGARSPETVPHRPARWVGTGSAVRGAGKTGPTHAKQITE